MYGVYNIGRRRGRSSEDRRGNRSDGMSDSKDRRRRSRGDRGQRHGHKNSDFEGVAGKLFLYYIHHL